MKERITMKKTIEQLVAFVNEEGKIYFGIMEVNKKEKLLAQVTFPTMVFNGPPNIFELPEPMVNVVLNEIFNTKEFGLQAKFSGHTVEEYIKAAEVGVQLIKVEEENN